MASDNSLLETVHHRGSHCVVHLAPELRQGKHFYLEGLCIWIPLPFYCHCPRQWWPPQMRKPGHSGFTLQLPWDTTWPESSFWGVGVLSCIAYESSTLPPSSLAFLLTPATHLEWDCFLWHWLHILTCHLHLAGSGCARSRTQSLASVGLQAPPVPGHPGSQHGPALNVPFTLSFPLPNIPQHSTTFYYLLCFPTYS